MAPLIIAVLLLLGFAYYNASIFFKEEDEKPEEPPLAKADIPVFGHLIGFARFGPEYVGRLFKQSPSPAYTLDMLLMKTYVINSSSLAASVHKNFKTLSFDPLLVHGAYAAAGMTKHGVDLHANNSKIFPDLYKAIHTGLMPGPAMDEMSKAMLKNVEDSLNNLVERVTKDPSKPVNLFEFTRDTMFLATSNAVYGPHNPVADKKLQDAYRAFEKSLGAMMLGIFPSILARAGYKAREEQLYPAMKHYFQNEYYKSGSAVTQGRAEAYISNGLSLEDMSRAEAVNLLGVLGNAVPATFWTLFYIFANQALLTELRRQVDGLFSVEKVQVDESDDIREQEIHTFDAALLSDVNQAPLLLSCFQETLRVRTSASTSRWVTEDTIISSSTSSSSSSSSSSASSGNRMVPEKTSLPQDSYLLKKGNLVQIPAHPIHHSIQTWGNDPTAFKPQRFLPFVTNTSTPSNFTTSEEKTPDANAHLPNSKTVEKPKIKPVNFRSFGGGDHICPGRHFATTEVLSFVAVFVYLFDLEPLQTFDEDDGEGRKGGEKGDVNRNERGNEGKKSEWPDPPEPDKEVVASQIQPPVSDIQVLVRARATNNDMMTGKRRRLRMVLGSADGSEIVGAGEGGMNGPLRMTKGRKGFKLACG